MCFTSKLCPVTLPGAYPSSGTERPMHRACLKLFLSLCSRSGQIRYFIAWPSSMRQLQFNTRSTKASIRLYNSLPQHTSFQPLAYALLFVKYMRVDRAGLQSPPVGANAAIIFFWRGEAWPSGNINNALPRHLSCALAQIPHRAPHCSPKACLSLSVMPFAFKRLLQGPA